MVIRFMFLELDTRNGTLLTNITSATNVTRLCTSRITRGISTYSVGTCFGLRRTVLPLILARSRPNILLAWTMSELVIGQSFKWLRRTSPWNSRSVGAPIIDISRRALMACLICRLVKPSKLSRTVATGLPVGEGTPSLTRMCAAWGCSRRFKAWSPRAVGENSTRPLSVQTWNTPPRSELS